MSTPGSGERAKVTVPSIGQMKIAGERIAMITAYDATFARIVDDARVEMILVGDSVGMVVQGEANTIPVTLYERRTTSHFRSSGARRRWSSRLAFGSTM